MSGGQQGLPLTSNRLPRKYGPNTGTVNRNLTCGARLKQPAYTVVAEEEVHPQNYFLPLSMCKIKAMCIVYGHRKPMSTAARSVYDSRTAIVVVQHFLSALKCCGGYRPSWHFAKIDLLGSSPIVKFAAEV